MQYIYDLSKYLSMVFLKKSQKHATDYVNRMSNAERITRGWLLLIRGGVLSETSIDITSTYPAFFALPMI